MKYIERIYPWLLLAPAALPVVVWNGLIYPYLVPKTLLFYAIILLSIAAFVLLATQGRAFFWSRISRWETWIPGALLVLAYVASLCGADFYRSFWSLFIRGDGLLMLTCVTASFYLIVLSADQSFFDRLLRIAAAIGSFIAVYGIGEWLMGGGRIGSLLGNAAFFAGYLGIALFATLAASRILRGGWRRAAFIGAGLQIVAIILSATRGTILALAVAGVIFLAYVALKRPEQKRGEKGMLQDARSRFTPFFSRTHANWARVAIIVLAIFSSLFFVFRGELAKVPFEPIARIASISTADTDVASRLFIWKNMLTEIGKKPLLGVGAEHIDMLFNEFYDPTQISEQWFDRSHNAFLDYAAQYGIGGLLLYATLIATVLATALRAPRRDELFALLAITYAVQNFFVFDTISSFWLLLALLAGLISQSSGETLRESYPVSARTRAVAWIAAFALVTLLVPVFIRPALAAYDLAQAYKYQLTDVSREVRYLSRGFALESYGDIEYGYEAYDMYANTQATRLTGTDRVDAYQAALAILTENFNRYTYDARTALYLAHVLSLAPRDVSISKDLLSSALERAIRLSPKRSQSWYILTNLSLSEANVYPVGSPERAAGYAAARDLLAHYITFVPTLAAPHFVLAQLLFASGDTKAAALEAEKGRVNYTSDLETATRAATFYENTLDLKNAAFFLSEVVRLNPSDTAAAGDLAKIRAYEQSKK